MGLDLDKLKSKKARRTGTGWTPKEGDNLIRILPHSSSYFTEALGDFALEFRSHFLKVEGSETQVFRCIKDRKGICGFCAASGKYKDSENPKLKKNAEQIRGSERHLMNIINLNDIPTGIQTYECGPKVYNGILDFMANPAWGDLSDPKEGRNVTLQMKPQGKTTSGYNEYAVLPHPQKTDITPHLSGEWHEKLDGLEASLPAFPTDEDVVRWLGVLGFEDGAPVPVAAAVASPASPTVAPLPAPTAAAPAPVIATAAPAPVVAVTPAPAGDPVSEFAAKHGLTAEMRDGKAVPLCYSKGPDNKDVGFNPAKFPCEKGCPVRAECQLKKLGIG